jgi:hypothetical protein
MDISLSNRVEMEVCWVKGKSINRLHSRMNKHQVVVSYSTVICSSLQLSM